MGNIMYEVAHFYDTAFGIECKGWYYDVEFDVKTLQRALHVAQRESENRGQLYGVIDVATNAVIAFYDCGHSVELCCPITLPLTQRSNQVCAECGNLFSKLPCETCAELITLFDSKRDSVRDAVIRVISLGCTYSEWVEIKSM